MTNQKPALSFSQVQAAMEAMIEKAKQLPNPAAIAIVDDAGNLKAYAAMDNVRLLARRHSVRKAYTAAIMGMDSASHAEQLKKTGRSLSDLGGDPNLTIGTGGVVVRSRDGVILGGVGVGGLPPSDDFKDEDLARVGADAMNL
jgi:uncharacterized protein GlcG (DUF336 family)